MAVEERRRSRLYERLAASIGHDEAGTMFELLPPAGSDVATSSDIVRLEERLDALERRLDDRIDGLEQRLDDRIDGLGRRVEDRLDDRLDGLRHEVLAAFRGELAATVAGQTRAVTVAAVSTALSVTGAAVALAQIL